MDKRSLKFVIGFLCAAVFFSGCQFHFIVHPIVSRGDLIGWVYYSRSEQNVLVLPYDEAPSGYVPLVEATVTVFSRSGSVEAEQLTDRYGKVKFKDLKTGLKHIKIQGFFNWQSYEFKILINSGENYLTPSRGHYIIVGIDEYPNMPNAENLKVSVKDAWAVRNVLYYENGLGGTVQFLTNEKATKHQIRQAIQNAAANANDNDHLLLYFSGYADEEIWEGGITNPLDHLVPYDGIDGGSIEQIRNSLITDGELANWLAGFPNQSNITVILDVSYAKTFIDGKVRTQSIPRLELLALQRPGYTVLAATSVDERNIVREGVGSMFTLFLVEGIETMGADTNWDNIITARELFKYVDDKMFAVRRENSDVPFPCISGDNKDSIVFVKY